MAPLLREATTRLQAAEQRRAEVERPNLESTLGPAFVADDETLRLIASLVHEIAPRHVVQFGCSVLTEVLALLGFEHGRMAVTTYEHDPWAAEELLNAASPYAINYRWLSFSLCPLVARSCGRFPRPVYDDRMTAPIVPYPADLVLIEGPPEELGGRGGMIYQALKIAREGAILLLLDVRPDEGPMLNAWRQELAAELCFVPGRLLDRHQAFVVHAPLAEPFALEHPRAQMAAERNA